MPNTLPETVSDTYSMNNTGANKYYKAWNSSMYHADKYCYHLDGAFVKRYESHNISHTADMCRYCVSDSPEVKDKTVKSKYR